MVKEELPYADQTPKGSSLDDSQSVVAKVNVKEGWDLAKSEGLNGFQMIVAEVEMTNAEETGKD